MMTKIDTILLAALVTCASSAMANDSTSLAGRGKHVFDKWCASCHATGSRMPGTASLAAKYGGSIPAALEERKDMNPDFIRHFVRNGVLIMPSFRKTEVSESDLDALAAHLSYQKK